MPIRKVKRMRNRRKVASGNERKRIMRNKGSTPAFPIHPEKTDAKSDKPESK